MVRRKRPPFSLPLSLLLCHCDSSPHEEKPSPPPDPRPISAEILGFPIEIWSAIFQQAIDESRAAIRSVNRAWRNAVDGTPQFWSRIVLDRKTRFVNLEFARLHLLNSANTPLDVVVHLPYGVRLDDSEMNAVVALLRQHVSRFCKLSIRAMHQWEVDHFITSIGRGQPAPLLEKFTAAIGGDFPITASSFPDAFFPAPRLVDLTMPADHFLSRTDPHLATVRSLTLDATTIDLWVFDIVRTVKAIPSLQYFTYTTKGALAVSCSPPEHLSNRQVLMPNLVSVDVSVPGHGLDLIHVLNAPLLSNIRFEGVNPNHYDSWKRWPTQPVITSLQRVAACSPLVKRLELRWIELSENSDLYQWLLSGQVFPNLEVLRLDSVDVRDVHLRESSGLGLSLTRLELYNCRVTRLGLIDFVQGRTSEFELVIGQCPLVTENDLAALATIVTLVSIA